MINLFQKLSRYHEHLVRWYEHHLFNFKSNFAKSSVYRTIKEYKSSGAAPSSKHFGRRPGVVVSIHEMAKDSVRAECTVQSFFFRNEIPTFDKLSTELNILSTGKKNVLSSYMQVH